MTDAKRLEGSLRSLRAEIEALDLGDEEARRRLDKLVQDLETALEHPKRTGEQKSLGEQLKMAILKLEVSHPRLAAVMKEVVEALGSMGI